MGPDKSEDVIKSVKELGILASIDIQASKYQESPILCWVQEEALAWTWSSPTIVITLIPSWLVMHNISR